MLNPYFLSIVFSFRNEEDVLPELVSRMRRVLAQEKNAGRINGHELIFVNDASSDASAAILTNLDAGHQDIRIINMSRTFGVFPCVLAGFAQAKGDLVIYMDADLQDPPEVIPELLQAYIKTGDADIVHTIRRSRKGEGHFKMFLTRIGYKILNRYSSVPITPETSDFKLLSRRAVNHVLQFKENKPYIRGLISWIGFKQIFVPYDRQARFAGKSKFFILGKKAISNFLSSGLINFSSVPLQIASYCGLCAILLDFLFIVHVLIQKISGHALPGWTAIMIVVLFLGGVQLFCLGVVGLYLHSVHEQTKMRPLYIIESTYGIHPIPPTA